MNSEEAEIRIDLHVRIDVILELIEESDEQGMVWCDGPYDVAIPLALPTTTPLPTTELEDGQWLVATLIGVAIGLLVALVALLLIVRSCYIALGVILWLMVGSVS